MNTCVGSTGLLAFHLGAKLTTDAK